MDVVSVGHVLRPLLIVMPLPPTALTAILPQELLEGTEEGEFELDFETMDDETVRKIDVFLRGIFGPPAAAASQGSPASRQEEDDEVSEGDLDDADESDD